MKKIYLLFSLLTLSAISFSENRFGVGIAGAYSNIIYKSDKNVIFVMPLFDINYNGIYIKDLKIGYSFYSDAHISSSIFLNPLSGFVLEGEDLEEGYKDVRRKNFQIALGADIQYTSEKYKLKTLLSLQVGEKGGEGKVEFSKDFELTPKFKIIPALYFKGYTEDYVNYYFGVEPVEAKRNPLINSPYTAGIAYSLGATIKINYKLTEHITLESFAGVESYSKEICDSPIVGNGTLYIGGMGIKYYF